MSSSSVSTGDRAVSDARSSRLQFPQANRNSMTCGDRQFDRQFDCYKNDELARSEKNLDLYAKRLPNPDPELIEVYEHFPDRTKKTNNDSISMKVLKVLFSRFRITQIKSE
jgi:hypothetical protein